jgi:hypothetical protein
VLAICPEEQIRDSGIGELGRELDAVTS